MEKARLQGGTGAEGDQKVKRIDSEAYKAACAATSAME
jgi:hypothetical protein